MPTNDPPPPRSFNESLPARWNDLCVALLGRDPSVRADGAAILAALGHERPKPARPGTLSERAGAEFVGRASHLAALRFSDVRIPEENLVGEIKRGFYQTMEVFNTSRIGVAALAYGAALGAYKLAYAHAKRRNIFGKPLIEHSSKRHEFAENIVALEAAWLMVGKAAGLKDAGEDYRHYASMAKLMCTEEAMRITQWAGETMGATGVLNANMATQYLLDARGALVGEGAPEIQKKIVAGGIDKILDDLL